MAQLHPFILVIFYTFVIVITVVLLHPVVTMLSLFFALAFLYLLIPFKQFIYEVLYYSFVFIFIVVVHSLFVHRGETILFFLNDHPMTLEAIVFGAFLSLTIIAVVFWLKTLRLTVSTDDVVYVFGNVLPKSSILIVTIFQIVPLMKRRWRKTYVAQREIGFYTSNSMTDRLMNVIKVTLAVLAWTVNEMIERSDIMKMRGYGLKGRTNFSIFKWRIEDIIIGIVIGIVILIMTTLYLKNYFVFYFYPTMSIFSVTITDLYVYTFIILLFILPIFLEVKEFIRWKYLTSKM